MSSLVVAPRFCGPPDSANGGYVSGLIAALARETVKVRLMKPPPLGVELKVEEEGDVLRIRHGDVEIAQATATDLDLAAPRPPTHMEAVNASKRCPGLVSHPFPTCFVCGPQRARGDGLRIFAGPLAGDTGAVAAPWVPDPSLDLGDGKVRPEFMWAALDCPGFFALGEARSMLLGEFTAHVDRRVHVDEPCICVGWRIGTSGRKHEVGTALYDEDGELCARARALWIEIRTGSEKTAA